MQFYSGKSVHRHAIAEGFRRQHLGSRYENKTDFQEDPFPKTREP